MNEQDFYKLKANLRIARDRLDSLKAEKLTLRKDRWELEDFTLAKQFDKLMEELKEFHTAYFAYRRSISNPRASGLHLLKEIADCQNVLDGIAFLVMQEAGIP